MAMSRRREAVLASIGFVLLGLLGYWALERSPQRPPSTPVYIPVEGAQGGSGASPNARSSRPGALGAGVAADATEVAGTVRDLLTGEALPAVSVAFVAAGGAELTTESGPGGRYRIALGPGRYRVRAVGADVLALGGVPLATAGPASGDDSNDDTGAARAGLGVASEFGDQAWLEVAAGSHVSEFDLRVVRLARIFGRVVDGDGEPLAGVEIRHRTRLLERVLDSAHTVPAGEAVSEAQGEFRIDVPPGEVTLIARASGRPAATTLIRWAPPGAELSGIELVIDRGGRIQGRVVAAAPGGGAEQGVAGARVVARSDAPGSPIEAVSAGDGGFELEAVPPGRLVIEAAAEGYAASAPVVVTLAGDPGAQMRGVTVRLGRPVAVVGRVVDEHGAGVSGATVRARRPLSALAAAQVETDGDGGFTLTGLGPGPLVVRADAPGYAPGRLSGIEAPATGVELVLGAGAILTGTVRGDGRVLGHMRVTLTRRAGLAGTGSGAGPGAGDGFYTAARQFLSGDGRYRFDDLPSGRYEVTASAPGFAPAEQVGVELAPGQEHMLDFDLSAGARVSGLVREAGGGGPIHGATVRLATGSDEPVRYSDRDGRFEIDDVAPGRRSLSVRHPAYVGRIETGLTLAPGGHETVTLELAPVAFGSDETIEFAGIGAVLAMEEQRLVVRGLVPHGPAEVAGLAVDDEVRAIDGAVARGRGFGDNIEAIRGVAGTVVRLEIVRGDQTLTRDVVRGTVRFVADRPAAGDDGDE
ncbi:carboxypeptidase regulatory-like domain-containing protein [Haliangium sp.]|uniref:carboxypeptidase regulatory-like domain-containing protein n=1 Tax=Haliangium sp. TaxID=2663208 RepID=UPI003D104E2D